MLQSVNCLDNYNSEMSLGQVQKVTLLSNFFPPCVMALKISEMTVLSLLYVLLHVITW